MWGKSNETFNNTAMLWIDQLRARDPKFVSLLQERWVVLSRKLQELTRQGGIIDKYATEVNASQGADYEIWKNVADVKAAGDYGAAVKALKDWINDRRDWAEANIADIGKVYYTVSYKANGQVVATEQVRYGAYAVMDPDAPAPEGKVFKCWLYEGDEPHEVVIKKDTTFTAEYDDKSEAIEPTSLTIDVDANTRTVPLTSGFFPIAARLDLGDSVPRSLEDFAAIEPIDATNQRIRWTSSDEAVASVDETNHRLILNGGGDVIITGTLYNGLSDSFTLHVDGEAAKYTIRFVNDDDTELQSSKLPRKETPVYTGATPTKAETDQCSYTFVGWSPEIVPVAGNAVYTATYKAVEKEKAKPGVYEATSGAGGTWTEGSTDPLVFVFKRTVDDETTIEHFAGIKVDDKTVSEKDSSSQANYTVEKGSAIVSLQPAFLATLAHGDHTLKTSFNDGDDVEVSFKTVAKESSSAESKASNTESHSSTTSGAIDKDDDDTSDKNGSGTGNKNGGTNSNASGATTSGTGTTASGTSSTSGKTTLARTGDASHGTIAWLVIALHARSFSPHTPTDASRKTVPHRYRVIAERKVS